MMVSSRTKRPVRCSLNRDEDMLVTGGRNPFLGRYKVGFQKNGKVVALDLKLYCNAGNSLDISSAVGGTYVLPFKVKCVFLLDGRVLYRASVGLFGVQVV
ncbi:hypothetical protein chiPu_0024037 [Chiloscyllium punctatum]|uniref:Aldehyde oxidase/xanthine dehydrogenase first molybdopterin binding domain-containing protein n=1 Tax=Chiloscyllium punctatum TaxID=137246 RepID=A0A401TC27_CHIPU|nr:hypothetical protein [Chiloscyllium punctatum]